MPGRLEAPRTGARRQHRGCRSPPTLKGMAQHASPRPAPQETMQSHYFRSICSAKEAKMSDRNKEYPRWLSVQITDAMDDRLEQVARGRDEAKAEVVRAALRAFLDEQEDMIGSRKHFTKAFGRRIDQVERVVAIGIWLNLQTLQMLTERLHKETVDVSQLLANSVGQGVELQAWIEELIEIALREKTKPPA
jgi:Arc/MetJ-type ribon-helix-helix transcriptional regulator